jgi:peptide-methionine (R)-S-oxide reductase
MLMSRLIVSLVFILSVGLASCQHSGQQKSSTFKTTKTMGATINKTEEEWKKELSPEQYRILREKGTEYPGSGEYNNHFEKGFYVCGGCGEELFASDQKFDSHCGWPSFDGEIGGGDKVKKIKDFSHGMIRTEIICARCGGHLGHLFDDGPTKSGLRYCVNSLSLKFKPADK